MSDEIRGSIGDDADDNAIGKNIRQDRATGNVINFTAPDALAQNIFLSLLRIEGRQENQGERLNEMANALGFQGERLRLIEADVLALKHTSEARQRQTDGIEQKFSNFEIHIAGRFATLEGQVAKLANREPGTVQLTRTQWIAFTLFVFVIAAAVAIGILQFYVTG